MSNTFISKQQSINTKHVIHDNGGRPFRVIVSGGIIFIYTFESYDRDGHEQNYTQLLLTFTEYLGYWSGYDSSSYGMHGNSILIQINKHKYIFVGHEIYWFKTDDEILDYDSPVGDSNVPYPVAIGEKNIYFMIEDCMVRRKKMKTLILEKNGVHMYDKLYAINEFGDESEPKSYKIKGKKILVERI